jgi:hypothetical protein
MVMVGRFSLCAIQEMGGAMDLVLLGASETKPLPDCSANVWMLLSRNSRSPTLRIPLVDLLLGLNERLDYPWTRWSVTEHL